MMTTSRDGISHSTVKQTATTEFASLPLARAYIDTVREEIGSLGLQELIDALERLDHAYHEFPELELDRPRRELSEGLRSAARDVPDRAVIPLLVRIIAFDLSCSSSTTLLFQKLFESDEWRLLLSFLISLKPSRKFHWHVIEPIVSILRRRDQEDVIKQIVLELLKMLNFTEKDTAATFGYLLAHFLSDEHPVGIDSCALAKVARSARRRPSEPPFGRNTQGSRDVLLAMAQRLRAAPSSQRFNQHPDVAWPSGRMSFDEFLLQWPCEVDLPVDLDDAAFIEEAYQAILLRRPGVAEMSQYLRLLQNGDVSRPWIIEDLLASGELRSLERRLRVVLGECVITEPGRPEAWEMPAVTWPRRSAT